MCRPSLRTSRYLLDSRSLHTVNACVAIANHVLVRSKLDNLAKEYNHKSLFYCRNYYLIAKDCEHTLGHCKYLNNIIIMSF